MHSPSKTALNAAELLLEQHQKNVAFTDLPIDIKPKTESDAYAIQSALFNLRKSSLGDIVGYKVALTSEVMQNLLQFPSPFSGPLHGNLIYNDGKILSAKDYGHLCIECEIAAVLKTDLPQRESPYRAIDIADAIDTIAPALEIVDDRRADYDRISQEVLTLIADNAWNAGLVHGKMTDDWRTLDLATLKGTVRINGQLMGEGYGRDVPRPNHQGRHDDHDWNNDQNPICSAWRRADIYYSTARLGRRTRIMIKLQSKWAAEAKKT
jgi:2-keto-4-pentenoate hydratase